MDLLKIGLILYYFNLPYIGIGIWGTSPKPYSSCFIFPVLYASNNLFKSWICPSNFLPISQEELNIIQKYVIENNIKPQTEVLVMENRLACPYWNHKCLIYEVRPLICKEFYCNKKMDAETFEKFKDKKIIPVDMWAIAKEIEKQRKKLKKNQVVLFQR